MTNKRMLHECFFQSEDVAEWSIQQRYLIIGIISIADDQGRLRANPKWLRAKLFAYDDVTTAEIKKDLEHVSQTNDTLTIYKIDGKEYIQLTNWWDYQSMGWAKPSEYPAPDGWTDRIRQNIYTPKQWVLTSGWPGVEDCTSYEQALEKRASKELPSELGSELPIFNVNVNSDSTKAHSADFPPPLLPEEEMPEGGKTQFSKLSVYFSNATGIREFTGGAPRWNAAIVYLVDAGVKEIDVAEAIRIHQEKGLALSGPWSIKNTAVSEMSKRKTQSSHTNKKLGNRPFPKGA